MNSTLKQATLLFLIKDKEILLAMKKRGFGVGRLNGVGGKPEGDESIEQTAIRECQEEICVTPKNIKQVAVLDFYFPDSKSDWNQRVFVYFCTKWQGDPKETDEMKPSWFNVKDIPYDEMWQDDKYWLPKVINGNYVKAKFNFNDNDGVLDYEISVTSL